MAKGEMMRPDDGRKTHGVEALQRLGPSVLTAEQRERKTYLKNLLRDMHGSYEIMLECKTILALSILERDGFDYETAGKEKSYSQLNSDIRLLKDLCKQFPPDAAGAKPAVIDALAKAERVEDDWSVSKN